MIGVAKALVDKLSGVHHPWAIVGGANLVLRGCSDVANDIDIITTRQGAIFMFSLLRQYAATELAWSACGNVKSMFFKASVQSSTVEVMGGPANNIRGVWVPNEMWANSIEQVSVEGTCIPLTSLAYEREINEQLQNVYRVRVIEECMTMLTR